MKDSYLSIAQEAFKNTNVNITSDGRPYLGAPIGTRDFIDSFVQSKVETWLGIMNTLTDIACTQPHAAYTAFTHGISNFWLFVCRTTPQHPPSFTSHRGMPSRFISTITGQTPPNDPLRRLLNLPARLGGLNIIPPPLLDSEYSLSLTSTSDLTSLILQQTGQYTLDTLEGQKLASTKAKCERKDNWDSTANQLMSELPVDLNYAVKLSQEKGASSWLTSLPISEHGFSLHKGAFRDALSLRYGWQPDNTPLYVFVEKNSLLSTPSHV